MIRYRSGEIERQQRRGEQQQNQRIHEDNLREKKAVDPY